MSVQAPLRPELRDDDGSGNEQHWRQWSAETDGMEKYVTESTVQLAGRAAMEGYDTAYFLGRGDAPRHVGFQVIQQVTVGSDNHIG